MPSANGVLDIGEAPNPTNLTNVNGVTYFSAEDTAHGRELWKYDGSKATRIDSTPAPARQTRIIGQLHIWPTTPSP